VTFAALHPRSVSKHLGRTQYTGDVLMATKLIESCTRGGQVLLSQSTLTLLNFAELPPDLLILHMGRMMVGLPPVAPEATTSPYSPSAPCIQLPAASLEVSLKPSCDGGSPLADRTLISVGCAVDDDGAKGSNEGDSKGANQVTDKSQAGCQASSLLVDLYPDPSKLTSACKCQSEHHKSFAPCRTHPTHSVGGGGQALATAGPLAISAQLPRGHTVGSSIWQCTTWTADKPVTDFDIYAALPASLAPRLALLADPKADRVLVRARDCYGVW
jgi:hypothetical protein